MFGKLMKYELRSYFKIFIPIWCALLALALINGFTLNLTELTGIWGFLTGVLPMMLLVTVTVSVFVLALVIVIQRFYRGLLGEEGYLMFTLPVTTSQLITAKLLSAFLIELISLAAALLAVLIVLFIQLPGETGKFIGEFFKYGGEFLREYPGMILVLLETLVMVAAAALAENLRIYTAIAIGHLSAKHRVGLALVSYIGIGAALSAAATALFSLFFRLRVSTQVVENAEALLNELSDVGGAALSVGIILAISLALCAIYFFTTRYILKRHLNLE